MREAHREAARILYEERNKGNDDSKELYVDLHGKLTGPHNPSQSPRLHQF
jgi:hypothetical protein